MEENSLCLAAAQGDIREVQRLLKTGVDIDAAPLMRACFEGHVEVAKLLLQHGADPTLRHTMGQTALDMAGSNAQIAELFRSPEGTFSRLAGRDFAATPELPIPAAMERGGTSKRRESEREKDRDAERRTSRSEREPKRDRQNSDRADDDSGIRSNKMAHLTSSYEGDHVTTRSASARTARRATEETDRERERERERDRDRDRDREREKDRDRDGRDRRDRDREREREKESRETRKPSKSESGGFAESASRTEERRRSERERTVRDKDKGKSLPAGASEGAATRRRDVPALLLTAPAGHRRSPSYDGDSDADKDQDAGMSRDTRAKSAREYRDKDKESSSSSSSSSGRRTGRTPRVPTVVSEETLLPSSQKIYASGGAQISPRRASTGGSEPRSSTKGPLVASQSTDDLKEFMRDIDGAGSLRVRARSQDSRPVDASKPGEEANSLSLAAPMTSLSVSGSTAPTRVLRERDRKKAATLKPDRSRLRKESDNDKRSDVEPMSQEKRRELMLQRLGGLLGDHAPSIAIQPDAAAEAAQPAAAAGGSGSTSAGAALPASQPGEAFAGQLSPASHDDWQQQVMRTLRSRTISTILSGDTTAGPQLRAMGITSAASAEEDPKKAAQRTMVVQEFVMTENNYKRDLQVLTDCWRARLEKSGLIPETDTQRIFGNVDELIVLSGEICRALDGIEQLPSAQQNIAGRFTRFIEYLRLYINYCANHNVAIARVLLLTQQSSKLKSLMLDIQSMPECKNLDLKSFLIKPLQRVTKYPLLFKAIAKNTSEGHMDFNDLRVCLERLRGIMEEIDGRTKTTEAKNMLRLLQERFIFNPEDPSFSVVGPSDRVFLMEERFEKVEVDKGATYKPCQLFLFNDMLLFGSVAKKGGKKSEAKFSKALAFNLRQIFVLEENKGFQVVSTLNDKTKVTITTALPEQKARWVERINAMTKELYRKDLSADDDDDAASQ